jgi:hypothetical protein
MVKKQGFDRFKDIIRVELMAPHGWKKAWFKEPLSSVKIKFNEKINKFNITFNYFNQKPEKFVIRIGKKPTNKVMFGSDWQIQDAGKTLKIWEVLDKKEFDEFTKKYAPKPAKPSNLFDVFDLALGLVIEKLPKKLDRIEYFIFANQETLSNLESYLILLGASSDLFDNLTEEQSLECISMWVFKYGPKRDDSVPDGKVEVRKI